jgi:hypothetical protein
MPNGRVSSGLKLNTVSLGRIRNGGYLVGYEGNIPSGASLLLSVSDEQHTLDVTRQKQGDILDARNMSAFLALIGNQKLWGTQATCRLLTVSGGKVVGRSNEQTLDCPVRPYVGRLAPELGRGDTGPKLQYTGVSNGRMLFQPAIDGCYYFAYGGKFETDNLMRGLNCITYAGAVFGVDPASGAMSGYGSHLAAHIGAVRCGLENKTADEVKVYFRTNPRGTYLMWSSTHTVIIVNGMVHEFSQSQGGYASTSVERWRFGVSRYWVRKTPKQF